MPDIIKNKQVSLTNTSVNIIQGRLGYNTKIKNIYIVNKLNFKSTVSVYLFNTNREKVYLIKEMIIPALKRFEIPINKSININYKEYVFAESILTTNLDIFCNYIETERQITTLTLEFQNQKGQKVNDIIWTEETITTDINRKRFTFKENENYTNIPSFDYVISNQKIIVYKIDNIKIKKSNSFVEYEDRFEIDMFKSSKPLPEKLNQEAYLKVIFDDPTIQWRYSTTLDFTDSVWNDQTIIISLAPGEYYLNFSDPNYSDYQFDITDDSYLQINLDVDQNNIGLVNVSKPSLMSDEIAKLIKWRLNNSDWYDYTETVNIIPGEHTIEFKTIDDYFDSFISTIFVYENQQTTYQLDNLLLFKSQLIKLIEEEPPSILVEVQQKAGLTVIFKPDTILSSSPTWRVLYQPGIYSDWKTNNQLIKLNAGDYEIEFLEINGWTKPTNFICKLLSGINTTIKSIYTKKYEGQLKISFIISDKYKEYLSWRLVRPHTLNQDIIIDWNSDLLYDNTLPQGTYQVEISEYVFQNTNPVARYSFATGNIISDNEISIKAKTDVFELLDFKELTYDYLYIDNPLTDPTDPTNITNTITNIINNFITTITNNVISTTINNTVNSTINSTVNSTVNNIILSISNLTNISTSITNIITNLSNSITNNTTNNIITNIINNTVNNITNIIYNIYGNTEEPIDNPDIDGPYDPYDPPDDDPNDDPVPPDPDLPDDPEDPPIPEPPDIPENNTGLLKVIIHPENLREIATWKLKSFDDIESFAFKSDQIVNVPYGFYSIIPSSHIGWYVRKNINVTIDTNNTITLVDLVYEMNGNLRVKINPNSAKDDGRWRIVGKKTWLSDNDEITLYPNSYEIEFKNILLHVKPNNINIVTKSNTVSIETVSYIPYGSLQVIITSNELLDSLGIPMWRFIGEDTWRYSESIIYIAPGKYAIEFNEVGNVYTHQNIIVEIESEQEKIITAEFTGVNLLAVPNKSNVSFYNFNKYSIVDLFESIKELKDVNQIVFNFGSKIMSVFRNLDPYLELYELTNFDPMYEVTFIPPTSGCRSGCFSYDDSYLVVSHNKFPYLTIYRTSDWSQVTLTELPPGYCNTCIFDSTDSLLLLGFEQTPYMKIYDTSDFSEITLSDPPTSEVFSIRFKSGDGLIAVGCYNDILLYNPLNNFEKVSFDYGDIIGTIYGAEFHGEYLVIITSLYFYIYHYVNQAGTYVRSTQISAPVTNLNTSIKLSENSQYLLIGCANQPYLIVYRTSDWSLVNFVTKLTNYCEKFDITKDLSNRDYVKIPTHTFPLDGYRGLRPYEDLEASAFDYYSITYGLDNELITHSKSQWRLLDSNQELIYDSGETTDLITHQLPSNYFDAINTYYWQVRYKSDILGWSFWSEPTSFISIYASIVKPINNTPVNGTIDTIETPTLTASTFTVVNSSDTHLLSQWKIWEYLNGEYYEVYDTYGITNLVSHTVISGKLVGKTDGKTPIYVWSVRYKGSDLGWSEWSDKTTFSTDSWYINKPVNTSPTNGEDDVNEDNLTLVATEFTCNGTIDSHINSRYEIYNSLNELLYSSPEFPDTREDVDIEYLVPTELLNDGEITYSWRIAYKGTNLGWSEWSEKTTFVTRILQTASVTVNITPNTLRWKWRESSSTIYSSYISTGIATFISAPKEIVIEFESYFGYITPSPITVNLTVGQIYVYNAVYMLIRDGSLKCNLTPSSGYWKLSTSSFWRASGYTEINLAYNVYNVEFKELTGYSLPSSRTVTINTNTLVSISETYEQIITDYYVRINISSPGGTWYFVESPENLYESGVVIPLTQDSGLIRFSTIENYDKPDDIYYNVVDYQYHTDPYVTNCLLFNAEYDGKDGQIKVILNTDLGAWMVNGITSWKSSGTSVALPSHDESGNQITYNILFKDINNEYWETPLNTTTVIYPGQTTTINASYENTKFKQIVMSILPSSLVASSDVKYRIRYSMDGTTWQNPTDWISYLKGFDSTGAAVNNNVIKNPDLGVYEIEFKQITGYNLIKPIQTVHFKYETTAWVTFEYSPIEELVEIPQNLGTAVIQMRLLNKDGVEITKSSTSTEDQTLLSNLVGSIYFKYAITADKVTAMEIAENKSHSAWSKDWYKFSEISTFNINNSTITLAGLNKSEWYLIQYKPLKNYFNTTPLGLISGIRFEGSSDYLNIPVTYMDYSYLNSESSPGIHFEILLSRDDTILRDVEDFYINVRVKNDYLSTYSEPKRIRINGTIKHRFIGPPGNYLRYPYISSNSFTIRELFGSNYLGYISNEHIEISIPQYELSDVEFLTQHTISMGGYHQIAKAIYKP